MTMITALKPVDWACAVGGTAVGIAVETAISGNTNWARAYILVALGTHLGLTVSQKFFRTAGTTNARQFLSTTSCFAGSLWATYKSYLLLQETSTPGAYAGASATLVICFLAMTYICKPVPLATPSVPSAALPRSLVKRWVVNEKEIRVFTTGENLELELTENGRSRKGRMVIDTLGLAEQIEYLKTCEAVEYADDLYKFQKSDFFSNRSEDPGIYDCPQDHHECYRIFKRDNDVVYQIYYRDERLPGERVAVQVPVSNVLVNGSFLPAYNNCFHWNNPNASRKYIELFDTHRISGSWPADLIPQYLRNLHVRKVKQIGKLGYSSDSRNKGDLDKIAKKIAEKLNQRNPFFVVVAPTFTSSTFTDSAPPFFWFSTGRRLPIHIYPDMWAVTLVCAHGTQFSNRNGCSDPGNHAEIIIEGIENGEYFMKMADLRLDESRTGQKILIEKFTNQLRYSGRSQVWLVEAEKVQQMIASIEAEKEHPPVLNPLGSDSIFVNEGEESCFTWARKKLEILDIHLGHSRFGWVGTLTSFFTPYPGNI